tara:strand:+ start:542 stop:727 length:186 start_codon:yes stop_codon:yes gene_type:complete
MTSKSCCARMRLGIRVYADSWDRASRINGNLWKVIIICRFHREYKKKKAKLVFAIMMTEKV